MDREITVGDLLTFLSDGHFRASDRIDAARNKILIGRGSFVMGQVDTFGGTLTKGMGIALDDDSCDTVRPLHEMEARQ